MDILNLCATRRSILNKSQYQIKNLIQEKYVRERSDTLPFFKDFMKWIYDNVILLYCFFLFSMACLFLGHEIAEIQNEAKIRHANNIVMNCNKLISRNIYE